jgi:hypothetical protein
VTRRATFRERLINLWQRPLDQALDRNLLSPQNTRRTAEALAGAVDEVILNLLDQPDPEREAEGVVNDVSAFILRAVAFHGG